MTQRSGWRPEHALLLALLVVGSDVLVALLFLLGVFPVSRWYGVAVLGGGGLAALLILAYSRKLRREQRPEWLETQTWRKGLSDKLHQDAAPPRQEAGRSPRDRPQDGI